MAIDITTLAAATPLKGFIVKDANGNQAVAPLEAAYVHYDDGSTNGVTLQAFVASLWNTLNTFLTGADNDDGTLNRVSELVAAIQANAGDIDTLTSGKVNTADIVDALNSVETNKPLSANQGRALKALIDGCVTTASVVNDVTTGGTDVPLSAQQGVVLKGLIDNLSNTVSSTKLASKVITQMPDAATWPDDMRDDGIIFYVPAAAAQSGD